MPSKPLAAEDLDHVLAHARESFLALRDARVFITGGTGFFGHWLLETFLHANRELSLNARITALTRSAAAFRARSPHIAADPALTLLEGDIRSFAFPAEPASHILHAATDSGSAQAQQSAAFLADSILEGTRRVLELATRSSPLEAGGSQLEADPPATHLLYISTGAIYGRSTQLTHTPETYPGGPDPLALSSAYDEAKRMSEHLTVAHTHNTAVEAVIARPFAFVGPHLPLDQHFAIGNFLGAALHGQPIHIKGDGTPRRSWLYMADLAIWLWTLLTRGQRNRAYNVGSDEGYTIAEAARLTAATLAPGLPVQIDGTPNPAAPLNSYVPDITRARTELGLSVTIPLAEALRRTAAWHHAKKTKE